MYQKKVWVIIDELGVWLQAVCSASQQIVIHISQN